MGFLDRLFGKDDESKRQQWEDIDDIMHIAFNEEESAMYDQFDELGEIPNSQTGDDDGEIDTPPNLDPDDRDDNSGGGFFGWLFR